jgi:hypothetical protein
MKPRDEEFLPSPEWTERFLSRVDTSRGPEACWPWTRSVNAYGYGNVGYTNAEGKGRTILTHRAAFRISGGKTTTSSPFVLHSCHNRACCNPAHLRSGTHRDNMKEMYDSGRGNRPSGENHWTHTRPERVATGPRKFAPLMNGENHYTKRLGYVPKPRKILPADTTEVMRKMRGEGHTLTFIAKFMSVSVSTVSTRLKSV